MQGASVQRVNVQWAPMVGCECAKGGGWSECARVSVQEAIVQGSSVQGVVAERGECARVSVQRAPIVGGECAKGHGGEK